MTAYLGAQLAALQLERDRLFNKNDAAERETEALRREVSLANDARERAEDELAVSRSVLESQSARLDDTERRRSAAEATVSTLLARLRAAEDEKSEFAKQVDALNIQQGKMEERLSDELVQARTELATTRFELDEATLGQRKARQQLAEVRQQLAASREEATSLEKQLAAERIKSADLSMRLEQSMQMARRAMKEREALAPVNANTAR
jgi:predicted  nucleic acid-binding Zn-ribbon protein